ncbi:YqcC family protein [Halomonas halmophila]|uniref:YqcC-like domain-containing protein n=1 Tax=Halomonas halmophila TaxID=252 RepID=A0A4Y4EVV6_9GAMM|nr:YqcC family protein [Halomonas halmophila]GED22052.1 hypothetical protein HHA01_10290 [Halomonas halmophila]
MTVHDELAQALRELESAMRAADMWRMEAPEPAAYNSVEPFCIDTMSLPQWLRFVFIARLETLVEQQGAMPSKSDVAPAVEAYLTQEGARTSDRILVGKAIERVDSLVTEN